VPKQLLEYISAEANWLPELKQLKSQPIKNGAGQPTRIKIFDIQPDSLLKKCGLQENDIIDLVDGEILEFTEANSLAYRNMFRAKVEKLRKGEPLTVTVSRGNKPLHLMFKL
jgi:S1-C subfamily serine protease